MAGLKRVALQLTCAGVLAALAATDARGQWSGWGQPQQEQAPASGSPPAATSRGENFSAGKSPAQLFASDCTGSGCHKGPQGLAKDRGRIGLAGFLREHYTSSRESASALAAYLASMPAETRAARPERQPRAAARSDDAAKPAEAPKPSEDNARTRKPPEESKPASSRTQRGRQATAAPASPAPAAAPAPDPAEPPAPPAEPPKPQWDIFD